jgi:hypothetical protein
MKPRAVFEGDGITAAFVGGDLLGTIRNRGSGFIWVNGHLRGEVGTGEPMTQVHVMGDFTGTLKPAGKEAALVALDVRGFAPYAALEGALKYDYTEFRASIGESDRPAGFYPPPADLAVLEARRCFPRWVIHRQREKK